MVFERISFRHRIASSPQPHQHHHHHLQQPQPGEPPHVEFEFDQLVRAFEAVSFDNRPSAPTPAQHPSTVPSIILQDALSPELPPTRAFLDAMNQVALFFDILGGGFAFVRRDIASKIAIIDSHRPFHENLTDAVLADIKAGLAGPACNHTSSSTTTTTTTTNTNEANRLTPTVTRTLLRLMWAVRFIQVLMRELANAYTPRPGSPDITLYDAVSVAYAEALAEKHPWGLRKAVTAALYLLPTKDAFVQKLRIDSSRFQEYLIRLNTCLTPLVSRTYAFYDLHQLHDR